MPDLCARLDKHQVVLLCFFLALLGGHFALIVQIGLVADEYYDNVVAALAAHVVDPFTGVLEGFGVYERLEGVKQGWCRRRRDILEIS